MANEPRAQFTLNSNILVLAGRFRPSWPTAFDWRRLRWAAVASREAYHLSLGAYSHFDTWMWDILRSRGLCRRSMPTCWTWKSWMCGALKWQGLFRAEYVTQDHLLRCWRKRVHSPTVPVAPKGNSMIHRYASEPCVTFAHIKACVTYSTYVVCFVVYLLVDESEMLCHFAPNVQVNN